MFHLLKNRFLMSVINILNVTFTFQAYKAVLTGLIHILTIILPPSLQFYFQQIVIIRYLDADRIQISLLNSIEMRAIELIEE